jgi:hypothetical protein
MNYSLVGKARRAAKNTMQSKRVRAANISNYASREATRQLGGICFKMCGLGGCYTEYVHQTIDRSKSLKVN